MKKEVKEWLQYANNDLDTAEYLYDGEKYKESSLFCQQAIEKALKALILEKKRQIIKIHDLVKLAQLAGLDHSFISDCERLTFVYIDSRYPGVGTEKYTEEETEKDIKIAKRIVSQIEEELYQK